ncbi:MAG TPA: glycoside hydrolase family 76 protein [Streptosporangiaceae bacterium]|nr:glycoside hydrolase family 76 protein [Streptosporangiaceae bacterium]
MSRAPASRGRPPGPPAAGRGPGPPAAGPDPAFRDWAGQAAAALQRWYRPRTGLWKTAGWWNCANALTALIQHSQLTGERRYRHVIETTFARAQRVNPGFSTEFYDDDGWWALAWIAAFDLTGEARYLEAARALFAGMAAGWDGTCGGGLWWTRGRTYKNAIPNELFLLVAGCLHRRAGSRGSGYLDWALREWQWFAASGLIGPSGLVNDGLTAGCANNGGTTWTYNQGVIIGGLAVLHEITGDGAYGAQAEAIAAAALRELTVPPGILAEPGERRREPGRTGLRSRLRRRDGDLAQFKGIFVRNLYQLYLRSPRPQYRDFILANATSLWRNSRNRRNQIGLAWTGPFDRADAARQGSALDALNAAVGVTAQAPG